MHSGCGSLIVCERRVGNHFEQIPVYPEFLRMHDVRQFHESSVLPERVGGPPILSTCEGSPIREVRP